MKHSEKHSGYIRGVTQWHDFLGCWAAKEKHLVLSKAKQDGAEVVTSLSVSTTLVYDENLVVARKLEIGKLENRLGVQLPSSYVDFLMATRRSKPSKSEGRNQDDVGFFDLENVNLVRNYAPDWLQRTSEAFRELRLPPRDLSPAFGTEQNEDPYKFGHDLPDAIVVGKHQSEEYALILLYPNNKTIDGEMEATLRGWSEEIQAPSFAELMRQLSYAATVDSKEQLPFYSPPYSQEKLKGSCADKLPVTSAWWK